jgi:hypothetical protein
MTAYRIEYLEAVISEDIPELPTGMAPLVRRAISARLAVNSVAFGKPFRAWVEAVLAAACR